MPPSLGTADQVAAKRFEILKRWLGFVGEGVFIEPPFTPDYGCNVIIGKNSYMNFGFTVLDTSLVIIGERVMLGPNVHIYSAGHDTSVLSRVKCIEFGHQVRIEDDCWIGGNVTVLAGVTIGRGLRWAQDRLCLEACRLSLLPLGRQQRWLRDSRLRRKNWLIRGTFIIGSQIDLEVVHRPFNFRRRYELNGGFR
ncbi:hypothetical protein VDGD_07854 [Verticillium dahliae]|nr:hypothetical protein VDGD_07854 [Verticillium dahliae]